MPRPARPADRVDDRGRFLWPVSSLVVTSRRIRAATGLALDEAAEIWLA
jgi:hypothetical protein